MAQNFIPSDREQQMLMPPDLKDWLPSDHLVWFVIDSVEQIDLSKFYAHHRDDGWGRAAYEPRMIVTLLLYSYSIGVRSAREIERRCQDDVAFRVITVSHRVDHATICRFRSRHREALSELFVSVLGLCSQAEMLRPEVVAIDGTKLKANASMAKNVTREQLEELAEQILSDAERIDAEEDDLYGDSRGDQIPDHLLDQATRIEWLKQKLAEQQEENARRSKGASRGRKRINTTDPDSALQKTPQGYEQGYNGQLAVTQDQVIVAADLTADTNEERQLQPMIDQAIETLRATSQAKIGTVVADAGYFTEEAVSPGQQVEVLVTPVPGRLLPDAVENRSGPVEVDPELVKRWEIRRNIALKRTERRNEVIGGVVAKVVTASEAALELVMTKERIYYLTWHFKKFGYVPGVQIPAPPPAPSATRVMLERFAQPGALATYELRARSIEPVFGQLKEARGMRQFLHRGIEACRCEWKMMATAHNLRKWWRKVATPSYFSSFEPLSAVAL